MVNQNRVRVIPWSEEQVPNVVVGPQGVACLEAHRR
jgi:hypothetical protein